MTVNTSPQVLPVFKYLGYKSYPQPSANYTYDKTGTEFEITQGDNSGTAEWAIRVWRYKPGEKAPVEIFASPDSLGAFVTVHNKLYLGYTTKTWVPMIWPVPGYIGFGDEPSGKIVSVDETAMAAYKAQVSLAQNTANSAQYNAKQALSLAKQSLDADQRQENEIIEIRAMVNALQQQVLTKAQIEDIVWTKIWDVNYLIRSGFRQGSSTIREVQDYLVDLATYIRSVTGR